MANAQTYQSEFTGQQMDAKFTAVAELQSAINELQTAVGAKYSKPAGGIPSTDLDADVNAALAKANSAIQSLADYYTKSEIDQLLAAINGMDYVDVSSLPTASASTMGKIYLVGPDGSGYYSYYYTSYNGSAYSWVGPLGTTQISLANYATKEELNQLEQKVNEGFIVDITDHGCVGDGVTDNTEALQEVLTTYAGYSIRIPSGVFLITGQISLPDKVYLTGNGVSSVIHSTYEGFAFNFASSGENSRLTLVIDSVKFTGTYPDYYAEDPELTDACLLDNDDDTYINYANITNCFFHNFKTTFHLRRAYWSRISNCAFYNGYDAIIASCANASSWTNNEFRALKHCGIIIESRTGEAGTLGLNITGSDFSGNDYSGILVLGQMIKCNITGNYFETTNQKEIVVGDESGEMTLAYTPTLSGSHIRGNSGLWSPRGIFLYGAVFSGNDSDATVTADASSSLSTNYGSNEVTSDKIVAGYSDLWAGRRHFVEGVEMTDTPQAIKEAIEIFPYMAGHVIVAEFDEATNTKTSFSIGGQTYEVTTSPFIADLSNVANILTTRIDISSLFSGWTALKKLKVISDMVKPVSLSNLFYNCANLVEVNALNWTFINTTYCASVFEKCSSLKRVDMRNAILAKPTSGNSMFRYCYALKYVNLSSMDNRNRTSMSNFFQDCTNLEDVWLGPLFFAMNVSSFGVPSAKWSGPSLVWTMQNIYDRTANNLSTLTLYLKGAVIDRLSTSLLDLLSSRGYTLVRE